MKFGPFLLTFVCLSVDLEVHGLADNKEFVCQKTLLYNVSLPLPSPFLTTLNTRGSLKVIRYYKKLFMAPLVEL